MTSFNSPSIRNYHHLYCRYWTSYDQMVSWCCYNKMITMNFYPIPRKHNLCSCSFKDSKHFDEFKNKCELKHQETKCCCVRSSPINYNYPSKYGTCVNSCSASSDSEDSQTLLMKDLLEKHGNSTDNSSEDELEMEITEDMMAFFEHSARHKAELALKKDRQGMEEEYCVNLENLSVAGPLQRSTLPPALQPNSKRIEEMTELYGKAAQTIYGMETSLQLTFDKFCDLKQPKLWPNIPFKF
ncbi:gem-associated protein 8-like isoform X1 [Limulus polyphemus]|uniref:Gem-associated protein 8-like isoform X1 n=1 Tax=Limulus polyphemus TaxID=6850 RepID=A0ABM1B4V6_LIMPO|nr:gem-associated protein 8-like isoform X1 [Limulus polyphemus]